MNLSEYRNPVNKSYGPVSANDTATPTTSGSATKDKKAQWFDYDLLRVFKKYFDRIEAERKGGV